MKSKREFFKSSFTRSVLMIAGGTALAQILNALISPIITRIYSPEEYGILTVYIAILGMLSIISSLKYEWGIPIADDDNKAINVLALSILVLSSFVIVIILIFVFMGRTILYQLNASVLLKYKLLIPLGIFFGGLYNILMQWAYREKNFKSISKTKLSQVVAQNGTKVILGLLKFSSLGLILGNVLGQSSGISTLSIPLIKNKEILFKNINKKDIYWCAKRFIKFPLFSTLSEFLNAVGIQLPVLLITYLYGSEVIGFYGLANGIVNLPMNLIGMSIRDVFYGEAASIGRTNPKRLKELSVKLFKKLIIIGLVPLITLVLIGPFLFTHVFGVKWYQAGIYSRIISFLVFNRLIFTPIDGLYTVFEKQKEALILDILRVILVLLVFAISQYLSLSSYLAVELYVIAMSIVYLITFLVAQKIINDEIRKLDYKLIEY